MRTHTRFRFLKDSKYPDVAPLLVYSQFIRRATHSVPDPFLEIREGPSHTDPEITGRGRGGPPGPPGSATDH